MKPRKKIVEKGKIEEKLSIYKLLTVLRDNIDESEEVTDEEKEKIKKSINSILEIFDRVERRRQQPPIE
jgi:ABC-type branched-subunit amino acid transport system ATPase component